MDIIPYNFLLPSTLLESAPVGQKGRTVIGIWEMLMLNATLKHEKLATLCILPPISTWDLTTYPFISYEKPFKQAVLQFIFNTVHFVSLLHSSFCYCDQVHSSFHFLGKWRNALLCFLILQIILGNTFLFSIQAYLHCILSALCN